MTAPVGKGRHLPFLAGAAAAALVALPAWWLAGAEAPALVAVAFFATFLVLTALRIPRLDAATLRRHAADDDAPMPVILLVTLGAVVAAVVSLFMVVNAGPSPQILPAALAFASVALGWLSIHTMVAVHYAHLFWRPDDGGTRGGLAFPETAAPEMSDFLYFAFVIGMTAQTADVDITTTPMRRLVAVHGVVSFFFNTVLVAASVNAAVAMAG